MGLTSSGRDAAISEILALSEKSLAGQKLPNDLYLYGVQDGTADLHLDPQIANCKLLAELLEAYLGVTVALDTPGNPKHNPAIGLSRSIRDQRPQIAAKAAITALFAIHNRLQMPARVWQMAVNDIASHQRMPYRITGLDSDKATIESLITSRSRCVPRVELVPIRPGLNEEARPINNTSQGFGGNGGPLKGLTAKNKGYLHSRTVEYDILVCDGKPFYLTPGQLVRIYS